MKHLYFIRHGQSTANTINLCGSVYDAELTDAGASQAKSAGQKALQEGIMPDVIISSPILRAYDTARLVASEIGYEEERIERLHDLRERWFGELEGKFIDKDSGVTIEHYFANPLSVDHISNIEKLIDLHKRAERVIEYAKSRPEDTVLLVSHGALARSIQKVIKGIPYDQPHDSIPNAKIIKLI